MGDGFKKIAEMRILPATALLLLLVASAAADNALSAKTACLVGDPQCLPKVQAPCKSDLKRAHKYYDRGQELIKRGKLLDAANAFDRAIELAPDVAEYVSTREMVRQQMVSTHIRRGNDLLARNQTVAAMGEFRQALALDPQNRYALQRLGDTLPSALPSAEPALSPALSMVSRSTPVLLLPPAGFKDFHLKGSSRTILDQIASAFGMKFLYDDSVSNRQVRFDMEGVDFFTALREAAKLAHVFWVPLTSKQLILFNDTQQLRREYERTVSATFYLSDATTPQELTDVVNMMRTLFDVRFAVAQPSNDSVVIRAPAATVDAASKVLQNFFGRKPQVVLNVQVYEVSTSLMRQLGLNIPTQFQVINVGIAALGLLGQGNIQNLINQLISSGGINAVGSQGLQALLSQLQNQQSSSLLQTLSQTPFATFGGGKTLFAIPFSGVTGTAQLNQSDLRSVQSVMLRAQQNSPATLRIGSRYPILNASFAPVFNSPAISQVIRNGSFTAPFPSFSYEDLGLSLKATPQVLSDSTINLKLEMQIKALTGQAFNGVPVLSNREYTATLSVPDGATTALVGMVTQSEQRSLSGLPGFSALPGIGALTSTHNKDDEYEELLIVVTPTIVSGAHSTTEGAEVWVPSS